jgi:hypothetical protein
VTAAAARRGVTVAVRVRRPRRSDRPGPGGLPRRKGNGLSPASVRVTGPGCADDSLSIRAGGNKLPSESRRGRGGGSESIQPRG